MDEAAGRVASIHHSPYRKGPLIVALILIALQAQFWLQYANFQDFMPRTDGSMAERWWWFGVAVSGPAGASLRPLHGSAAHHFSVPASIAATTAFVALVAWAGRAGCRTRAARALTLTPLLAALPAIFLELHGLEWSALIPLAMFSCLLGWPWLLHHRLPIAAVYGSVLLWFFVGVMFSALRIT